MHSDSQGTAAAGLAVGTSSVLLVPLGVEEQSWSTKTSRRECCKNESVKQLEGGLVKGLLFPDCELTAVR